VIVFVSDRKQARMAALDLMILAASDNAPKRFLNVEESEIKQLSEDIKDIYLAPVLNVGIGFLYEGMDKEERKVVETLFEANAITILISTYKLCWELTYQSNMVVVLDN